jgi:hypothetical protein
MKPMILALAMMTFVRGVAAADKPNFSGEWKLNASMSNFGSMPPPDSFIRTIVHVEPNISIVDKQFRDGADMTTLRENIIDGKPIATVMNDTPTTTAAEWDGQDLVETIVVDSMRVKFCGTMRLSEDGKLLTSKTLWTSPQGSSELILVFERQNK